LPQLGFTLEEPVSAAVAQEEDERLRIAEKAIQTFQRTTQVGDGTFRLRVSVNAHRFFDEILPDLQRVGIFVIAKVVAADQNIGWDSSFSDCTSADRKWRIL